MEIYFSRNPRYSVNGWDDGWNIRFFDHKVFDSFLQIDSGLLEMKNIRSWSALQNLSNRAKTSKKKRLLDFCISCTLHLLHSQSMWTAKNPITTDSLFIFRLLFEKYADYAHDRC